MSDEYFPHFDVCEWMPYDAMHVELEGIVRYELAWLLYVLVKKFKYFTEEAINAALRSYPMPTGRRVPDVQSKVFEGSKGGHPRTSATMGWSASQTLHFALAR